MIPPHVGSGFAAKVGSRWKQLEVLELTAESIAAICVTKSNGMEKWFPKNWVSIERVPGGRLLVKYPEWMD